MRKPKPRTYRRLNKVSLHQKLVNDCLNTIRAIRKAEMTAEKGEPYCEICGRPESQLPFALSVFHIFPRSKYPKLILNRFNILLACWNKEALYYIKSPYCHNIWERQKYLKDGSLNPKWVEIENRIIALRGEDYREQLLITNKTARTLKDFEIVGLLRCLKEELEALCKK